MQTIRISTTQLHKGDVVHAHGARFEIVSDVTSYRGQGEPAFNEHGVGSVAACTGRWIDGAVVRGYFGPNKDWTFQGNHHALVRIEPRA
ncbi:hypothetical protein E2P84_36615 [Burkholderia cepacia]|uniref:Uncharacterized protein n=1 Tax=Burkholderia cepacia TaxID=292 RepID=A0AAX2RQN9_BURCE|nr:hypothetical protein [Burkholderia cepacia]TES65654.1 hypothetical protein E2P84_36615 [Burkholderia cepacia]TET01690.1 hypothetical protein E3D36_16780 [Burkholderia cepacia]TEU47548.1 hypothetical protein E3D37_16210 [Burkholderia cepacia]TEU53575.1 hypothetical protein E3D38_12600 [Burkholderia cepacia]TEV02181.1 hypothetical protein E3D40_13530 [Burkholderia cepacia]